MKFSIFAGGKKKIRIFPTLYLSFSQYEFAMCLLLCIFVHIVNIKHWKRPSEKMKKKKTWIICVSVCHTDLNINLFHRFSHTHTHKHQKNGRTQTPTCHFEVEQAFRFCWFPTDVMNVEWKWAKRTNNKKKLPWKLDNYNYLCIEWLV